MSGHTTALRALTLAPVHAQSGHRGNPDSARSASHEICEHKVVLYRRRACQVSASQNLSLLNLSYEPPHFRVDSQDLVMGTHGVSEAPLEFTAGSMQTGHHG